MNCYILKIHTNVDKVSKIDNKGKLSFFFSYERIIRNYPFN